MSPSDETLKAFEALEAKDKAAGNDLAHAEVLDITPHKPKLSEKDALTIAVARLTGLINWYGWTEYRMHWECVLEKLRKAGHPV